MKYQGGKIPWQVESAPINSGITHECPPIVISPRMSAWNIHLCIYVPSVLGAYLLHHHSSKPATFSVSILDKCLRKKLQSSGSLPAVIEQQVERLRTVRQAAAQGILSLCTVPLLADAQTHNKGKIQWSLNDVKDELSQLVKKVEKDSPRMRKGTSSSIVGY